jgi:hypothetical protein
VVEDGLFSTMGWNHQKWGNAYEDDEGVFYVSMMMMMTKLAKLGKLIFDKQDRFVHLATIARKNEKEINFISFPRSS